MLSQGKILCNIFSLMAIAQSNRIHIPVYSWSIIFYLQVNPNTPTMAYNQQQQQPQQYIVAGQMINIGNQVLEQQQQFVTVDPNAMGSSVGKIDFFWIPMLADPFYLALDLFYIFSCSTAVGPLLPSLGSSGGRQEHPRISKLGARHSIIYRSTKSWDATPLKSWLFIYYNETSRCLWEVSL